MLTQDMHETIRGLYQGIVEPTAWQRSLSALCDLTHSAQATLLVRDTERGGLQVKQTAARLPDDLTAPPPHVGPPQSLPFPDQLQVGGWHIHRHDFGIAAMRSLYPHDGISEMAITSTMTCLVSRQPGQELYLTLQRPAGAEGFSEADARALDWVIPHVRDAVTMRDRTQATATHGHVSANLLNQLPFGVIVFANSGQALLANAAGEPWVRRLLPMHKEGAPDSVLSGGPGWRLSRPFPDVMRTLADPSALQAAGAIQAVGADGRLAQIVAMRLTPGIVLGSAWQGQPVLVAIHEAHAAPRAVPAVLRDLYGLTPAETRLAALLISGMGLPDATIQLGIKRETGRSQLKAIFTKTSTSTQAQLAHLLTRLGSLLAEPAGY
ncbi:MAG: helix-turn-helix transcriptional regulator [Cupriavidus sp.]|nr:helix-turn-helix transcriptional regulator [Cupriavidus sp.]